MLEALFTFLLARFTLGVEDSLPIVYVYELSRHRCEHERGHPDYLLNSLRQAILTQFDGGGVFLISNFRECPAWLDKVGAISGIRTIDSSPPLRSSNTIEFERCGSTNMFNNDTSEDFKADLWIKSATRFLVLEDASRRQKWKRFFHVEADNLIYPRLSRLMESFVQYGDHLALQMLNVNRMYMTASLVYVPSQSALSQFNLFMTRICLNRTAFLHYLNWLQSKTSNKLQRSIVNEMSIFGYYHSQHPKNLHSFPILPSGTFASNRYSPNFTAWANGGHEVGPPIYSSTYQYHRSFIFDPNSWGQLLDGVNGLDKARFRSMHTEWVGWNRNPDHIIGQLIRLNGCLVEMQCSGNPELFGFLNRTCFTSPFVMCGSLGSAQSSSWAALVNLHVHSKQTHKFVSRPCACAS